MFDHLFNLAHTKNFDYYNRDSSLIFAYGNGEYSGVFYIRDDWETGTGRYGNLPKGTLADLEDHLRKIPTREQRKRNFIMRQLSENLEVAKKMDGTLAEAWRKELEEQIDRRLLEAPPENLKDVTPLLPDDEIPY